MATVRGASSPTAAGLDAMEYTRPVTGRSAAINASGVHSAGYFASTSDTCEVEVSLAKAELLRVSRSSDRSALLRSATVTSKGRAIRVSSRSSRSHSCSVRVAPSCVTEALASSRVASSTASMADSGLRCTMPSASPGL